MSGFWAPETCISARGGKAIADFNPCDIAGLLPDNDVAMITGEKWPLWITARHPDEKNFYKESFIYFLVDIPLFPA